MTASRHAAPRSVDIDNVARPLERLELGRPGDEDGKRREAFIQDLVHDHPSVLPMAEIEPAFSPLIAVCKELPTSAGYLDNLWITPWGGLVLGEAKLVRNPQARREVVAQALDYARAFAGWRYDDLQQAVRTALKQPEASLWAMVRDISDLDEVQFVDAVERRLANGRLMLLIIGDGIQEGVEALTAHLQLHAGLHVGLALVDLSIWKDVKGSIIVVPRVPMRTVLVERGIVRLEGKEARIDPPPFGQQRSVSPKQKYTTQSEGEYFDRLHTKRPELVSPLKVFLTSVAEIGVSPEYRQSVVLRFSPNADVSASAGYIEANGKIWFDGATKAVSSLGRSDVADRYASTVAAIVGGTVKRYEKSAPQVLGRDGRAVDASDLLSKAESWKRAIAMMITDLAAEPT